MGSLGSVIANFLTRSADSPTRRDAFTIFVSPISPARKREFRRRFALINYSLVARFVRTLISERSVQACGSELRSAAPQL